MAGKTGAGKIDTYACFINGNIHQIQSVKRIQKKSILQLFYIVAT
jgi:hypothetical protein